MTKRRLDTLLAERGLFESRSRAAAAVMAGDVRVAGAAARKPGELVADDAELTVTEAPPFVSRAGIKLANALDALGLDPAGCRALDVGGVDRRSSPTACSSAAPITWWQSTWPTGELHWRLRNDPRVTVVERRNARALRPGELPYAPDLVTIDVSFISLRKLLGAVLACAAPRFDCLAMVKPQFEVGRERVGKGGVVRAPEERRAALVEVGEHARERLGVAVLG